jgi:hypothetical protein
LPPLATVIAPRLRLLASFACLALAAGPRPASGAEAGGAGDAAEPTSPGALAQELRQSVSADELRTTIQALVGFGTRHTLSDTASPTRGIGAARRWVQGRFARLAQDCGGCLEVLTPSDRVSGSRVPQPAEIVDVLAVQRGTREPMRVVMITAHLDSRVTDVMNATSDAPGADDDGSGVSAVLEAARVLSKHRFAATLVYGVLSGEEQGLYGGKLLAAFARRQGWQVEADLNNDIIGNTLGPDGVRDDRLVRVFSEGTRSLETAQQAARRRYNGGELDSPSRNLARFLAALAQRELAGLAVEMVYRTDRYGRGGDQVPMLEAGFPAVRITESREDYSRQHQDLRTEGGVHYGDTLDGIDFPYLAQVTRLNAIALGELAAAPAPPAGVKIEGAVSADTTVAWQPAAGAARYRVWRRRTTEPQWRMPQEVAADEAHAPGTVLRNTVIDDWFFGVSAVSTQGFESPVVFPGEAGAF